MIIRHKKLPIIFEYKDSDWNWASDFIIKELNESGWMNYTILPRRSGGWFHLPSGKKRLPHGFLLIKMVFMHPIRETMMVN